MGGADVICSIWENGGGYVGVERRTDEGAFAYYIGMFCPADTPVPDGFVSLDFHDLCLGTCWIYGSEKDVHNTFGCRVAVEKEGMKVWKDGDGATWSFENCTCLRYTTPDEKGNVILDYYYFVNSFVF